jgi:putative membrane protein insertion efficiency factor
VSLAASRTRPPGAATRLAIGLIGCYRRFVSPLLGRHCRYEPTCSRYAIDALSVYGGLRGGAMALRRIARCHPWAPGGFDPLPPERSEG